MSPQTFIFVGRSGCGKGTQALLLKEYLQKTDPTIPVLDFQTGDGFRRFIKDENNYSSKLAKGLYDKGARQPDFLAIWIWAQVFVDKVRGGEHIIADGFPRSVDEAKILDTALNFYQKNPAIIIYIKLSIETTVKRLLLRGRHDDNEAAIKERMAYYEKDVTPVLEYFKNSSNHKFFEISGEPSVEEIHQDIISKIFKQ